MSEVSTILRNRCSSNDLWEEHIKQQWGRLTGEVAYKGVLFRQVLQNCASHKRQLKIPAISSIAYSNSFQLSLFDDIYFVDNNATHNCFFDKWTSNAKRIQTPSSWDRSIMKLKTQKIICCYLIVISNILKFLSHLCDRHELRDNV